MIVEERIYTLQIGCMAQYMKNYEEHGLAVQKRILGHLVGYYQSEIGPLNQAIHMWGYENFEERERRRKELFADPDWLHYLTLNRPHIISQENKILVPASFAPPPNIA